MRMFRLGASMSADDPFETCDELIFQLAEHRDSGLNLVRRRSHQTIVARQTLRGSLQNDFSQVCF